jgi:hypothetical protein
MREIRRRSRVLGCFPDGNSALMLAAARLRYIAGTKWGSRRYLNMKRLQELEAERTAVSDKKLPAPRARQWHNRLLTKTRLKIKNKKAKDYLHYLSTFKRAKNIVRYHQGIVITLFAEG